MGAPNAHTSTTTAEARRAGETATLRNACADLPLPRQTKHAASYAKTRNVSCTFGQGTTWQN